MATCKDCKNCELHVGYWICKAVGNKKRNPLIALDLEGVETCDYFDRRRNPFYQSTLSRYIREIVEV